MDAVLYLGPASESGQSRLAASLCADAEYRRMRARRAWRWQASPTPRNGSATECALGTLTEKRGADMKGMYRPTPCLSAILISAAVTAAQTHADFSGVWKPVESAGSLRAEDGTASARRSATASTQAPYNNRSIRNGHESGAACRDRRTRSRLRVRLQARGNGEREPNGARGIPHEGNMGGAQSGPYVSRLNRGRSLWGKCPEVYRMENGDLIIETARKTAAGTFTERSIQRKQ